MDSLVSVVIPTYGKPEHLGSAIDSVLKQDYSPLELIIVDDNGIGTEHQKQTRDVINSYNKKGFLLRYICHEINKNGSAARNTGINAAKGEYIALLDDDDIFLPDKISHQVEVMQSLKSKYKLCYVSFSIFFPDGRKKDVIVNCDHDISLGILTGTMEIPSSALMFSKSAWECVGGFDESFLRHQDWEFIIRIGQICDIASINEICMYRIICRRNSPANAIIYKNHREHFLMKMSNIISKYPIDTQNEILYFHRLDIAFQFFKTKKFVLGIKQLFKCGKPFTAIMDIINRVSQYCKAMRGVKR